MIFFFEPLSLCGYYSPLRREVGYQIIVTPALPTTVIAPLSLGDSYELMDNVQLRSEK
jgi:hypothetical protein